MMLFREEDVVIHQDAAVHVHLSRDDDLSMLDTMMEHSSPTTQRLVVRCSAMPNEPSALHRLERALMLPQFTDVTILLSNGISQLPLDVFRTFFASRPVHHLQLLVSGRSTSVDGLILMLACWQSAVAQGCSPLPKLTVGCTWHHPRPAAQWQRLNSALDQLDGTKVGLLDLTKITLRSLPHVEALELSHCTTTAAALHTASLPTSLVIEPLPPAVPTIVQWLLKTAQSPRPQRLGLNVYRLSDHHMQDLVAAVAANSNNNNTTLALLGLRSFAHFATLYKVLPNQRVRHLEVETVAPNVPVPVAAIWANWHVQSLTWRRRWVGHLPTTTTTTRMMDNTTTTVTKDATTRHWVERALERNRAVQHNLHSSCCWANTTTTKDNNGTPPTAAVALGPSLLHQCPDVTLRATWLLAYHHDHP